MLYLEGAGIKGGRGGKKEMKSRRRSSLYMTESTKINHTQKLKDVGTDNKDKESIDERNNVRYLRIN
jgi:hypothetical protein